MLEFLFRLDWPFFFVGGGACMKLRQNGTVFFMIKLSTLAAGRNSEQQKIEY
jgi:hypothetical protein